MKEFLEVRRCSRTRVWPLGSTHAAAWSYLYCFPELLEDWVSNPLASDSSLCLACLEGQRQINIYLRNRLEGSLFLMPCYFGAFQAYFILFLLWPLLFELTILKSIHCYYYQTRSQFAGSSLTSQILYHWNINKRKGSENGRSGLLDHPAFVVKSTC